MIHITCSDFFFFFLMSQSTLYLNVHQTVVSLMSLDFDSVESGLFSTAPSEAGINVSSFKSTLESVVEELVVLGSSASCPWSERSCRNEGTSSCSFVKRPRWSSTLQHWARVSISRNPDAVGHDWLLDISPDKWGKKQKQNPVLVSPVGFPYFTTIHQNMWSHLD